MKIKNIFFINFMIFWSLTVIPIQWNVSYANSLPGQKATRDEVYDAVQNRTDDIEITRTLKDLRDKRLSNNIRDNTIIRNAPSALPGDSVPIRSPNLNPSANPSSRSNAPVADIQIGDIIHKAQSGNDLGYSIMPSVNISDKELITQKENPEAPSNSNSLKINNAMPGFNNRDYSDLVRLGGDFTRDPNILGNDTNRHAKSMKRIGCRKTDFILLESQNIEQSVTSHEHRVLKVEFYDVIRERVGVTEPPEYKDRLVKSYYKKGVVKLKHPTIGSKPSVWFDKVDNDFAIKYVYTPYDSPKKQNFFTYNQKLAIKNSGSLQVMPDSVFSSYGNPSDAFSPNINISIPLGVEEVYLSADLYRTDVYYYDPNGGSCPSDPPSNCVVQAYTGQTLNWCAGSPGHGIFSMYDDIQNPSSKAKSKSLNDSMIANGSNLYSNDSSLRAGVVRAVNARNTSSIAGLVGQCSRNAIGSQNQNLNNGYHVEDVQVCSETLINPYPNGCNTIKRSFGMSRLGENVFLSVKAYNKIAVPITNPSTGAQVVVNGIPQFTYVKEIANVSGGFNTNFNAIGPSLCPSEANSFCSTEIPDNPDGSSAGYFIEYVHTPMVGESKNFAINGILMSDATGSFSHYGNPSNNWTPVGSAIANGDSHEVKLIADVYAVTVNTFFGCEDYINYAADGLCQGGRLTCIDSAPTRTIGGVTFGNGLPNSGIVDVLKNWGSDSSAVLPDFNDDSVQAPTPTGGPLVLLNDKMCWEAVADPFSTCQTMDPGSGAREFSRNGQIWKTDCNLVQAPNGNGTLETSSSCVLNNAYTTCDSRFLGLYTNTCYNKNIGYDCGTTVAASVTTSNPVYEDTCTGAMRCMGTQCIKPNLSGSHGSDFAIATSRMEALNMMKADMVCAETGEKPQTGSDACTPSVFGGKALYCKIPIGNEIGITPNCCKEAKSGVAANGGPNWIEYLQAGYLLYKIQENALIQGYLSQSTVYNSTATMFGEIAAPITDAFASASQYVTENFVQPLSAGFDNLFTSFGSGGSVAAEASSIAVDSTVKEGVISQTIEKLKQKLLETAYNLLKDVLGPDIANTIIVQTPSAAGSTYAFAEGASKVLDAVSGALMVYSLARLIGHIVFACAQEEYEWAMNDRWRLCTYADSCCSRKITILFAKICIEKRQLYCCYKSIAGRVISEQIIKKNLTRTRPYGYRTAPDGGLLRGCSVGCHGFTPMELSVVDWSQVDLSEWLDSLIQSGLFHPENPNVDYGNTRDSVPQTMTVGRTADGSGFDQRVPATKTIQGISNNISQMNNNTILLKQADEHCYDPNNNSKMPFTYPSGCPTTP